MSKEIATIKRYDIDKPAEMSKMADVLKGHIVHHKLYTTIKEKNYAHVEGWQFAGGLMGLFPKVVDVENLSSEDGKEIKWKAQVDIVHKETGNVVSTGFALCSSKEVNKKAFDEYAILSMAQTRAIGKAYRNLLGWVMKLAGYEATPKEEMIKVTDEEPVIQREEKSITIPCRYPNCKNRVSEAQAKYSEKMFKGKVLCAEHQAKINSRK